MRVERSLESVLEAERIQVVPQPRVVEIGWEPFRDECGAESLTVRLVLEGAERGGGVLLTGARTIWEALLDEVLQSGELRFPYVHFQCRRAAPQKGGRA